MSIQYLQLPPAELQPTVSENQVTHCPCTETKMTDESNAIRVDRDEEQGGEKRNVEKTEGESPPGRSLYEEVALAIDGTYVRDG